MLRIALTGGIASGKSTVCRLFSDLGVPIIDADLIARELVEPHQQGWWALVKCFGSGILNSDDTLNRKLLRSRVFSDVGERQKLDAIMHPLIYATIDDKLLQCQADYCLVAVPLLIETGASKRFDRVLVIDCLEELQVERLLVRDDIDAPQAKAIMASQADRKQRLAAADDVIDNSNDQSQLAQQVKSLHNFYINLAITRKLPA